MPLLITTKLKDGGEGGHLALFLSLGIGWTFVLLFKLWGGGRRYVRTHMLIVYYTMVMVPPLLTFVDLNKKSF